MVGTITPLVEEAKADRPRLGAVAVIGTYIASSVLGGAVLLGALRGLHLALAGLAPRLTQALDDQFVLAVAVVAVYALLATAVPRLRLPMIDRQVPLSWRGRFGPWQASVSYAFVLGTGVMTRINSPGLYFVPVVAFLGPAPLRIAAPLLYALARASIVSVTSIVLSDEYFSDFSGAMNLIGRQRLIWTGIEGLALSSVAVAGVALAIGA